MTTYNYQQMCDYLFKWHAPNFNFEHGGEELLEIALERGFIGVDLTECPDQCTLQDCTYFLAGEE